MNNKRKRARRRTPAVRTGTSRTGGVAAPGSIETVLVAAAKERSRAICGVSRRTCEFIKPEATLTSFDVTQPDGLVGHAAGGKYEPELVKGCRKEHALENGAGLLLCSPSEYQEDREHGRHDGTMLVWDFASDKVVERPALGASDTTLQALGADRSTMAAGDNCLVWCASTKPRNKDQWARWKASLDPSYDHVTAIPDPVSFADSIATMMWPAQDLFGSHLVLRNPKTAEGVFCRNMTAFHGPVAYTDDRRDYILESPSALEFIIRSVFIKTTEHRDQREYRFAVVSESRLEIPGLLLDHDTPIDTALSGRSPRTPRGVGPVWINRERPPSPRVHDCLIFGQDPGGLAGSAGGIGMIAELHLFPTSTPHDEVASVQLDSDDDVPDYDQEELERKIASVETSPGDARITKVVIDGGPGSKIEAYATGGLQLPVQLHIIRDRTVPDRQARMEAHYKIDEHAASTGELDTEEPSTDEQQPRDSVHFRGTDFDGSFNLGYDSQQVILEVTTANPDATVRIDQPCPSADLPSNHVPLAPDRDTYILITATSPDGTKSTSFEIVIDGLLGPGARFVGGTPDTGGPSSD